MDFYALLGLNRAASRAEIVRAYRRLARRYHPGVNPGDSVAAERYRLIQNAYDILADVERRQDYDRGAVPAAGDGSLEVTVAFDGFDFSATADGAKAATFAELFADVFHDAAREATTPSRGVDIEETARVSFEDAVRGGAVALSITRHDRCPACLGDGRVPRPPVLCPACGGQGTARWARGHMVFTRTCEHCDGQGRLVTQTCRACAGVGLAARSEMVTVMTPPGLETGARVAVPGRGHAGALGGPAGDLYVTIEVTDHRVFRRLGRDLHVTLPVGVHEAGLGAEVDVPTLEGPVRLKVPPGTAAGTKLRVRGRGVPAASGDAAEAGDLIAEVQIVLPAVLDPRSVELLREFGRRNGASVRQHLFDAL
jgi:molecular chaperone DnaJ